MLIWKSDHSYAIQLKWPLDVIISTLFCFYFQQKKNKRTNNDLQNTVQKTKDWATWTSLLNSTNATRRCTLATTQMISHKKKKKKIPHCQNTSKIKYQNQRKRHTLYPLHTNTWSYTFLAWYRHCNLKNIPLVQWRMKPRSGQLYCIKLQLCLCNIIV
jgi:hypothetical protein